jgi:hypothetical protein
MSKSKLSTGLYLLLVFLSGALMGGFSYRLYSVSSVKAITASPSKLSPEEFRKRYIEDMRTRVGLDQEQVKHLNQILDETRAQFDEMRGRMKSEGQAIENQRVEKISAMLRDSQKPAFVAFRAEREKLRRQAREKQRNK